MTKSKREVQSRSAQMHESKDTVKASKTRAADTPAAQDQHDQGDSAAISDAQLKEVGQATMNSDVQILLAKRICDLEVEIQSSEHRTREAAKRHKKSLRDVQRIVEDKTRTPADIIAALQQRTLTAVNDAWKLEKRIPELEAKVDKLLRQTQIDQAEMEKGLIVRNKLQELCRELQKQNKEAQNENRLYQEEEKAKRQQMVENVNNTVASITERLDQQQETVSKQAEENALLKEQLQRMIDTVQASDSHSKQQAKAHDLERQLWEAKQQQQAELLKKLEERGEAFAERYDMAMKENDLLTQQVKEYQSKFQEFQVTLKKSNEMFDVLKSDAKAMRGKERDLMERNLALQQQYERAGTMLLRTTEENATLKETNSKLTLANERLQSLCRALQGSKVSAKAEEQPSEVSGNAVDSKESPGDDKGVDASNEQSGVAS